MHFLVRFQELAHGSIVLGTCAARVATAVLRVEMELSSVAMLPYVALPKILVMFLFCPNSGPKFFQGGPINS